MSWTQAKATYILAAHSLLPKEVETLLDISTTVRSIVPWAMPSWMAQLRHSC